MLKYNNLQVKKYSQVKTFKKFRTEKMTSKNQTKIIAEKGKQELFIIREFDAPRELVFKAFAEPDLLIQFLGPKDLKMRIDYYDFKNRGSYRYIHVDEK